MANTAGALIEAAARAAFAVWRNNGHEVSSALLKVHTDHVNPAVRRIAGSEYDAVLQQRMVWDAYELQFTEWAKAEGAATRAV